MESSKYKVAITQPRNATNWKSSKDSSPTQSCRVCFTGRYSIDQSRLQLTIIRAENLSTIGRYQSTVYIRWCFVKKQFGDLRKVKDYRTREIPCNSNPTFADTITIMQDWKELISSTIHFQVVYCTQRGLFRTDTKEVVAEGQMDLRSIKSSLQAGKIIWCGLDIFRFPCDARVSPFLLLLLSVGRISKSN